MIGPKVTVKKNFVLFDRSIIRRNWSGMVSTPITRAGNFIRVVMRRKIRRVRRESEKPAAPPHPPKSRQPGKTPPFKQIFSVPNKAGSSAIIGMVGYGDANPVPGMHEHGGSTVIRMIDPSAPRRDSRGRWAKLRWIRRRVAIPRRPFALPSLEEVAPRVPTMFRGSFNSRARSIF